jgi:hypothetical protein
MSQPKYGSRTMPAMSTKAETFVCKPCGTIMSPPPPSYSIHLFATCQPEPTLFMRSLHWHPPQALCGQPRSAGSHLYTNDTGTRNSRQPAPMQSCHVMCLQHQFSWVHSALHTPPQLRQFEALPRTQLSFYSAYSTPFCSGFM